MKKYFKVFCALFFMTFSAGLFASDWYICLGSFKDKLNAQNREQILNKNNVPSFVIEHTSRKGEKLFRVLLDEPIKTEKKAEQRKVELEKKLTSKGLTIKGIWYYQPYASSLKKRVPPLKETPKVESKKEEKKEELKEEKTEESYSPIIVPSETNDVIVTEDKTETPAEEEKSETKELEIAESSIEKSEVPATEAEEVKEETKSEEENSEDEIKEIIYEENTSDAAAEEKTEVPAENVEEKSEEVPVESEGTEEKSESGETVEVEAATTTETETKEESAETENSAEKVESEEIPAEADEQQTENKNTEKLPDSKVEMDNSNSNVSKEIVEGRDIQNKDNSELEKETASYEKETLGEKVVEEPKDENQVEETEEIAPEFLIDVPAKDPYKEKIEDLIEVYGTAEI